MITNCQKNQHFFFLISFFLLLITPAGCSWFQDQEAPYSPYYPENPIHHEISEFCIDVYGKAIGDIIPNATVYLFLLEKTDYTDVMKHIRKTHPIAKTKVNSTKEFGFPCLGYGKYVFVVNSSEYNQSRGSPLPYAFDCENVSVDIIFQGGDLGYATGVFEIRKNFPGLTAACKSDLISNLTRKKEKGFYQWCPYCSE